MSELPEWHGELTHKDWWLNGDKINEGGHVYEIWQKLDWSRAYVDMGPSPAGNLGPYWHVPWDDDGDEIWTRLYPRLLGSKWVLLVRQAVNDAIEADRRTREAAREVETA